MEGQEEVDLVEAQVGVVEMEVEEAGVEEASGIRLYDTILQGRSNGSIVEHSHVSPNV